MDKILEERQRDRRALTAIIVAVMFVIFIVFFSVFIVFDDEEEVVLESIVREESVSPEEHKDELDCSKSFVLSKDIDQTITSELYRKLIPCLREGQPQELIINSDGGDAWSAYGIYDALRIADQKKVLTTRIFGNGHSAAIIVFLAADRREISCNSSMLLHNVTTTTLLSADNRQIILNIATQHDLAVERYAGIVAERIGLSIEEVKELMDEERLRLASEIMELGIATDVVCG